MNPVRPLYPLGGLFRRHPLSILPGDSAGSVSFMTALAGVAFRAMEGRARIRTIRPDPATSHLEAVLRAEAYVRAHPEVTVPVSQLSHVVGLSERGLRDAFYSIRGMGPKRSMLEERLHAVRRVLRDGQPSGLTVTEVAATFRFYELGRFAGVYKRTFGEAPSDTLRRSNSIKSRKRTRRCLLESEL